MSNSHKMVFQRFGRSQHLRIASAEDLAAVLELDEAHWVATGAPIETINCDPVFLKLMDTDNNGRLMCFEVKDAIVWLLANLHDTSGVTAEADTLRLDAINTDSPEGAQIHESASKTLAGMGLSEAGEITLEQVRRFKSDAGSEAGGIALVEKLILYQVNLLTLANNFVSFPHLYDPASRAAFEMGTLVMDGRRFNFSVKVADRAAHSEIARTGNMFVLYAEIAPGGGREKYEIATSVTSGGKGNLCVGKRGMFEDVAGVEADARIVEIIENPISLGEAIVSPFQRLARALTGKIEAMTTTAETKLGITPDQPQTQPQSPAPNRGLLAGGLLVGGSVAIAALGSAFAYISKTLAGIELWKILLGIAIAILAVMLPTTIVAILKLRRRDLSAILEGAGWAINARMRLTRRQSRFFTQKPDYRKK